MPTPALSRTRLAVIAALAVLVVAGAGALAFLTSAQTRASLIGGPFALQTGDGRTVTDKDMLGHPFLVYFGYTHCPDVCPTALAQISDVLGKIPDKNVKALFITVDPERDTPKTMGDYVSSFDSRIVGLSGSPADVAKVEQEYRVYAKKGPER